MWKGQGDAAGTAGGDGAGRAPQEATGQGEAAAAARGDGLSVGASRGGGWAAEAKGVGRLPRSPPAAALPAAKDVGRLPRSPPVATLPAAQGADWLPRSPLSNGAAALHPGLLAEPEGTRRSSQLSCGATGEKAVGRKVVPPLRLSAAGVQGPGPGPVHGGCEPEQVSASVTRAGHSQPFDSDPERVSVILEWPSVAVQVPVVVGDSEQAPLMVEWPSASGSSMVSPVEAPETPRRPARSARARPIDGPFYPVPSDPDGLSHSGNDSDAVGVEPGGSGPFQGGQALLGSGQPGLGVVGSESRGAVRVLSPPESGGPVRVLSPRPAASADLTADSDSLSCASDDSL